MAALRAIPDTRGGRIYRRILLVALVASIIGVADQVRALFWAILTGETEGIARLLILLAGWVLIGWCGFRAFRSNAAPPSWALLCIPLLIWSYILWPS